MTGKVNERDFESRIRRRSVGGTSEKQNENRDSVRPPRPS